jgi:CubicO group peptidase (beta-lactamase class C family)
MSLVYNNPPGASGIGTVNTRAWRGAVHPSTNGHANARAVARVYELLASGGGLDGVRLVDPTILAAATTELAVGPDRILGRTSRFGFGFQLTQPERPLGPGAAGFGHFGAGGSLGMADPGAGLAFGYVMNRFGHRWQDPRNQSLLAAAYACL